MGCSFSVANDTDKPVWISTGVCHESLWGSIGAVCSVLTLGTGCAVSAAEIPRTDTASIFVGTMEGVIFTSLTQAGIVATSGTCLGLTAAVWSAMERVSAVLGITESVLSQLSETDRKKVLDFKIEVERKLEGFTMIRPGERFVSRDSMDSLIMESMRDSLNLVKSIYVINDDGKIYKHNGLTGETSGSDNTYNLSRYFC